jgi:hypothetical protein
VDAQQRFAEKEKAGGQITQEVGYVNKKTCIPPDFETSNKTVEKDGLECQVSRINPHALKKYPQNRPCAQTVEKQGGQAYDGRTCKHHYQQDNECTPVVPYNPASPVKVS